MRSPAMGPVSHGLPCQFQMQAWGKVVQTNASSKHIYCWFDSMGFRLKDLKVDSKTSMPKLSIKLQNSWVNCPDSLPTASSNPGSFHAWTVRKFNLDWNASCTVEKQPTCPHSMCGNSGTFLRCRSHPVGFLLLDGCGASVRTWCGCFNCPFAQARHLRCGGFWELPEVWSCQSPISEESVFISVQIGFNPDSAT